MSGNVCQEEIPRDLVDFKVNGMPSTVFNDWNQSCIEEFADCRWVKMMNDHLKARQFDSFIQLYSQVLQKNVELEERIINLEKQIDGIKRSSIKDERITLG